MSCQNDIAPLLPFFAAGTLDEAERPRIEAHLAACQACRADLALWHTAGDEVSRSSGDLPGLTPLAVERVLARASASRVPLAQRATALLTAQVPLVRRGIWLASALVMALGYLVALLAGRHGVLDAIAPLVAAFGVSAIYGPQHDPAFELTLATPTSPRQVLFARLVLVFGYDLALALVASLGLLAVVPPAFLGSVIAGWLAPMTFLSALALVLSMAFGTGVAVSAALLVWQARWLAPGLMSSSAARAAADAYVSIWQQPAWLFGLALACLLAGFWTAGRNEGRLRTSM